MIILPAIDLMNAQVVRLRQGKASEKTVYSDNPVEFALRWEAEGGDYLHMVDLDAAFTGEQRNLESVRKVAAALKIPVELGGGMRNEEAIARALDAGVARVVIGTRACESIDFVEQMATKFGSERIVVGIDAKDGMVSVKGWTELSSLKAIDLARQVETAGAATIVYTDISTDGMMQGPNFGDLQKMMDAVKCNIIASGGVSTPEDVFKLREVPNLYGAIIGKALYEGAIKLAEVAVTR